ncbi:MAG: DUF3078 domain-containing protein [Burkholderiales bacterium]|nr:DUF3078 domain-containing protein [Flavobacterium sp.]
MKKGITLVFVLLFIVAVDAQNSGKELVQNTEQATKKLADSTNLGWKTKGNFSLLFNQSNFNNWLSGGENNLSGNVSINYDFNYKKKDWTWDNKVLASYGLIQSRNASFEKKTDDRFEFNSIVGKKAFGQWYYSFFLNFRTQFTKGYIYSKNSLGVEERNQYTDFISPGYLTFGPGLFWKKNDNLKVNLAPLTSKLTFVDKSFTLPNKKYFGVKEGESIRYELGFYASLYYKLNLMTNVSAENTLNLYSNYLENPQNVDVDYSLAVVMRINRYLSANILFQAIYDDNAFEGLQTREIFGVGINFGF